MISSQKTARPRVTVHNIVSPGHVMQVDGLKYDAMCQAILKVLPRKRPGLTYSEMSAQILTRLPEAEFPGGAKAGWWLKCTQLDLEWQRVIERDTASKPLRWYRL